jgi:hypothetical protein
MNAQVNPTTSSFTQMTSQPEYQSPFSITTTKSDLFGNWSIDANDDTFDPNEDIVDVTDPNKDCEGVKED